jgi:hypothetical protein
MTWYRISQIYSSRKTFENTSMTLNSNIHFKYSAQQMYKKIITVSVSEIYDMKTYREV